MTSFDPSAVSDDDLIAYIEEHDLIEFVELAAFSGAGGGVSHAYWRMPKFREERLAVALAYVKGLWSAGS